MPTLFLHAHAHAATPRCSAGPRARSSVQLQSAPTTLTSTIAASRASRWQTLQAAMLRQWHNTCFQPSERFCPRRSACRKKAWHNRSGKRRHYTQPLGLRPRHDHNPQRPPRQENGDTTYIYSTLEEIAAESDFISIHTPYSKTGPHSTRHLLNSEFLSAVSRRPLIINAARGPVADTQALKTALSRNLISGVAIDCWENKPDIDLELLSEAFVATPHIAGYSNEGKIRATRMVLDALASHLQDHFGLDITAETLSAGLPAIGPIPETITEQQLGYDINADHIARNLPLSRCRRKQIFRISAQQLQSPAGTSHLRLRPHTFFQTSFRSGPCQNTV